MNRYLKVEVEQDVLEDLMTYQKIGVLDPTLTYPIRKTFKYNIHDVITKKSKLRKYKNEN